MRTRLSAVSFPSRQRGLTWLGWLVVLFVVGVFGIAAVNMVPAYSDYNTIRATIDEVMADSRTNLMSPDEIEDNLAKRFDINNVTSIHASDLDISKSGGQLNIGVNYDVQKHLFYNVSVVMHFEHTFTKTLTNQ
jgi:hypothetical protein